MTTSSQLRMVRLGASADRVLVFVVGFLARPEDYRALLAPLPEDDLEVVAIALHGRGPRALAGHPSPAEEAVELHRICTSELDAGEPGTGRRLVLAGHSRGGQVAWRAARGLHPEGLVLLDPVDGSGPWTGPEASRVPPAMTDRSLVVGFSPGGRCAPDRLGHREFARADPSCWHAVVEGCGHADVLQGRARRLGRRLCGGAADPDAARATVTALMRAYLDDALPADPAATDFQPDGATVPVAWV